MTVTSRTVKSLLNALAGGDSVLLEGAADELLLFEGEEPPVHVVVEQICTASFDVVVRMDAISELTVIHGHELWQPDGGRTDPIRSVVELMHNDRFSVAVIIRQAGIVLQDPSSHDLPDRTRVAALELAIADASKNGLFRNTCILLSPKASDVPEVIRGAQRLTLVIIGRPDRTERRHFLLRQLPRMHGGATLDEASLNELADTYARLTDQHSLLDIESLVAYSIVMRIVVTDARRLLHTRRFGEMPDHWGHVRTDLPRIAAELASNIFGQDAAIEAVVAGLAAASLGLNLNGDPLSIENQPRLVLFFLGPTGVGKTELAKELARVLFGDTSAYMRIDGSTLAQEHAADRLTGSPPGYVGFEGGGQLTNAVQSQPCRVILFDEWEKAHRSSHDRVMSIIDDGRVTDAQGRVAYFGESVIIMTSNLGGRALVHQADRVAEQPGPAADMSSLDPKDVEAIELSEAEAYFDEINRPEHWGRLRTGAVPFQPLRAAQVRKITERCLRLTSYVRGPKLDIDVDSAVARMELLLGDRANRNLGARQIRNWFRATLLHLASWIVLNGFADAQNVHITLQLDGALVVTVDELPSAFVPAPHNYSSAADPTAERNPEGDN